MKILGLEMWHFTLLTMVIRYINTFLNCLVVNFFEGTVEEEIEQ